MKTHQQAILTKGIFIYWITIAAGETEDAGEVGESDAPAAAAQQQPAPLVEPAAQQQQQQHQLGMRASTNVAMPQTSSVPLQQPLLQQVRRKGFVHPCMQATQSACKVPAFAHPHQEHNA